MFINRTINRNQCYFYIYLLVSQRVNFVKRRVVFTKFDIYVFIIRQLVIELGAFDYIPFVVNGAARFSLHNYFEPL